MTLLSLGTKASAALSNSWEELSFGLGCGKTSLGIYAIVTSANALRHRGSNARAHWLLTPFPVLLGRRLLLTS